MKRTEVIEKVEEEITRRSELLCKFVECWHYGTCLYTEEGLIEHRPTLPPEMNLETGNPRCFLAKDWFKASKKIAAPTLEELKEARREAKRRQKDNEDE